MNAFTDQQLITLALAIIIPLSLLIYSNSRITDVRASLAGQIGDSKETLRAEMGKLRAQGELDFEKLTNKIDHLADEIATLKEMMSSHLRETHNVK